MLVKAIENDKWIEGTPEYWAKKKAELAAKYGHETKAQLRLSWHFHLPEVKNL